jgi:hypothetical protein
MGSLFTDTMVYVAKHKALMTASVLVATSVPAGAIALSVRTSRGDTRQSFAATAQADPASPPPDAPGTPPEIPPADDQAQASSTGNTSITVNGQSIEVPVNGSVSQTVTSDDSTAHVQAGSTQNSSSSSLNVTVQGGNGSTTTIQRSTNTTYSSGQ